MEFFRTDTKDVEWLSKLDWSNHDSMNGAWISDHMFLADAAVRVGMALCGEWPLIPSFLTNASNDPRVILPELDQAFDADGAVASMHERSSDLMRRVAAERGVALPYGDAIALDDWNEILFAADEHRALGSWARRTALGIARAIAMMAKEGELRTYAVDIRDRDVTHIPIPRDRWAMTVGHAAIRLANCGLNLDNPRDPDAPVTHRIFVDEREFDKVVTVFARNHYIDNVSIYDIDLTGDFAREVDSRALFRSEIDYVLRRLIIPERSNWNRDRYHAELQSRLRTGIPRTRFLDSWRAAWISFGKTPPYPLTAGRKRTNA